MDIRKVRKVTLATEGPLTPFSTLPPNECLQSLFWMNVNRNQNKMKDSWALACHFEHGK